LAGAGPRNFGVPLAGWAGKWSATIGRVFESDPDPLIWSSLLALVALTTQAAALACWWRERPPADPSGSGPEPRAWWRVGISFAALMLVAGAAVWEGDPGAVTRVLLPMTVAFNVLLPGRSHFWPLWIAGNANLMFGPAEFGWRF
jgi:hypothetical protein